MDQSSLFFMLALCLGAGSGGAWWFLTNQRKARILLDMPTSKIRSAAQGHVELYGFIADTSNPLQSPLSHEPCVWWSYRIEQQSRKNQPGSWRTLEQGSSEALFELNDSTGSCLIDPRGARVLPLHKHVWYGDLRHPHILHGQHWLSVLLTGRRRYRYTEHRLHVSDPLYAIGHFQTLGGGHRLTDLERLQGDIIRQWKQDFPALLKRFDRNKDGKLSTNEWQTVRETALQEASAQAKQASTAPARHYLRKPDENLPFILACQGEDALAKKLRWHSLAGALLCLGSAICAAYLLNNL